MTALAGVLFSLALFSRDGQSRATSQVSPLNIEVVKDGRVAPLSAVFRPGDKIQIRGKATRRGRLYFFQRESGSAPWKSVTPTWTFSARVGAIDLKAAPQGNDVLVVLGFEELGDIDPGRIAAAQPAGSPGQIVSWAEPDMAVSKVHIRVRSR